MFYYMIDVIVEWKNGGLFFIMPITEMLSLNAQMYPNDISLIERDPSAGGIRREITWMEFEEQSNQLANALLARGIGHNDKVGYSNE